MRVRIDRDSRVPESEQLRVQLQALVERGTLAPGERVPTVRELAERLALAANTVAKAYRELQAAGLLVGRGRLGTFVADRLPARPADAEVRLDEAARVYARRARQLGFGPEPALASARRALARRAAT